MKIDLCRLFGVEEGEEFKVNGKDTIYFITDNILQYKINSYHSKVSQLKINEIIKITKLPKKKQFTDDELCILRNIKSEINTLGRNINGTIYVTSDYGKSYLKLFNNLFQSLDIGEEIIIEDYVER